MQTPRHHPPTQSHHHLDNPGDPSSRLRMPDIRLHRPQKKRNLTPLPIRSEKRPRLDRIPERGPRPMPLHHIHVPGREPPTGQRRQNHPLLRRPIRRGQPIRSPVLIDGRPPHHRQHPMPIPPSIRQPLQQHEPNPLPPPRPISRSSERLASPIGSHPPLPREPDEHLGRSHDGDTPGESEIALPLPQSLRGQMNSDQRRGTRRIDGHRRPFQTERVGHPPRHHTPGPGQHGVPVPIRESGRVVVIHHPRIGPGPAPLQRRRIDPRPLQHLPRRLQQQPLLRIHRQRLTRIDPEEPRIEIPRIGQEGAFVGVTGPGMIGIGMEEVLQVPPPVGGERAHRVDTPDDQLPQLFR
ncbi:hypothetical protein Saa2_00824 [Streptomyces acidiscabies]|nr:hypothetical protein Saa2_00824 [Streptomyces acidiscabies]